MSVAGIAGNILTAISGLGNHQNRFQQIRTEFQQLGQDLQSGDLAQAQSDFTTLSQNLPGLTQNASTPTSATGVNPGNSIAQTFAQLGQALQSGNLSAAQQDFTTIQQDAQQNSGQHVGLHHHHHHTDPSQSSTASSQPTNSVEQAFSQLAQTLQTGNLQAAQAAFSALQNDLQQIGGFSTSQSSGTAASTATGQLNVTA